MSSRRFPKEFFLAILSSSKPRLGFPIPCFPNTPHHPAYATLCHGSTFSSHVEKWKETKHSQEERIFHLLQTPCDSINSQQAQFINSVGHVLWTPWLFREESGGNESEVNQRIGAKDPNLNFNANMCTCRLKGLKDIQITFLSHTSGLI